MFCIINAFRHCAHLHNLCFAFIFFRFSSTNLYGLGYELSPVYRHVLYNYRTKHKNTRFGSEPHFFNAKTAKTSNKSNEINRPDAEIEGFPGFNSGVILLNLERLRRSKTFANLLKCDIVQNLTKTYSFKGHLGDQDFFTLLGFCLFSVLMRICFIVCLFLITFVYFNLIFFLLF